MRDGYRVGFTCRDSGFVQHAPPVDFVERGGVCAGAGLLALVIVPALVHCAGVKRQRLFTAALSGLSKGVAFGLQVPATLARSPGGMA